MLIGIVAVQLLFPWAHSLKDKRQEMRSLIQGLQHKFHFTVAESNFQDLHQRGEISIVFLTNHANQGDSIMEHVVNYIETHTQGTVLEIYREYR